MQNLYQRVENDVKNVLAVACLKLGIDKGEVGYSVGGGGAIAPKIVTNRQTGEQAIAGFEPSWAITISVRSKLLGQEPIAGNQPIFDVLPTRPAIEHVVTKVLGELIAIRDKQAEMPTAGPTMKLRK